MIARPSPSRAKDEELPAIIQDNARFADGFPGKPKLANLRGKLAVVGTYTPRICGIATFTADLVNALRPAS